jgi:hypothetical protein
MAWTERFVRADADGAGDGTTDGTAWTLTQAVTNEAAGMRINVKAGTYASATTVRTLAAVGTTTAPIWWRGYNTTPGDLDTSHALSLPLLTFTSGQVTVSGAHHILSNLYISGAVTTSAQLSWSGAQGTLLRSRVENTGTNALSRALTLSSGSGFNLLGCWLSASPSAAIVAAMATANFNAIGTVFHGGGVGVSATNTGSLLFCVFDNNGGNAVSVSAVVQIIGCSIYSPGGNGVEFTSLGASTSLLANNLFVECAAYGVNNSTGTNTNFIRLMSNGFFGNVSGNVNGITEGISLTDSIPAVLLNVQLDTTPFTNALLHDLSVTSVAKALGFPGTFEGETYIGYMDLGATQRREVGDLIVSLPHSPITARGWEFIG